MTNSMIWGSLAAFDMLLVGIMFATLKSLPPEMRRKGQPAVFVGTIGFVFHAIMFFDGVFLGIQLTMIAAMNLVAWIRSQTAKRETRQD